VAAAVLEDQAQQAMPADEAEMLVLVVGQVVAEVAVALQYLKMQPIKFLLLPQVVEAAVVVVIMAQVVRHKVVQALDLEMPAAQA
jgi:hypothetical protein